MAKIDTTSIEGYESMTAEEKLAALEALEIPEPDYNGWVKKDLLDKANSEAAAWKKKHREQMTAEEAEKAAAAEKYAEAMARLEVLEAEKAVGEFTAQFMGLGYDANLAKATAEALHKGDVATLFKNHAKFTADREKALKAELLKDTPTPPAGEGSKGVTKEDVSKMNLADRAKFAAENPEQYKTFYGGN